jgi:hypothetical protein
MELFPARLASGIAAAGGAATSAMVPGRLSTNAATFTFCAAACPVFVTVTRTWKFSPVPHTLAGDTLIADARLAAVCTVTTGLEAKGPRYGPSAVAVPDHEIVPEATAVAVKV